MVIYPVLAFTVVIFLLSTIIIMQKFKKARLKTFTDLSFAMFVFVAVIIAFNSKLGYNNSLALLACSYSIYFIISISLGSKNGLMKVNKELQTWFSFTLLSVLSLCLCIFFFQPDKKPKQEETTTIHLYPSAEQSRVRINSPPDQALDSQKHKPVDTSEILSPGTSSQNGRTQKLEEYTTWEELKEHYYVIDQFYDVPDKLDKLEQLKKKWVRLPFYSSEEEEYINLILEVYGTTQASVSNELEQINKIAQNRNNNTHLAQLRNNIELLFKYISSNNPSDYDENLRINTLSNLRKLQRSLDEKIHPSHYPD